MHRLAVTVRQHDAVVVERVCRLRDGMVLGAARGARVTFPGAVLHVIDTPKGWSVGGRLLRRDRAEVFRLGEVQVEVEGLVDDPAHQLPLGPDPRILLLTVAALVVALSLDAVARVADAHQDITADLQARLFGRTVPEPDEGAPAGPTAEPRSPDAAWPPAVRLQADDAP
ncbi:MAG: hypothetical protein H6733_11410 [Alphaproteobacteria bacterium]|nr:hypothetical protein [Alphaproteobacteria bacterium]